MHSVISQGRVESIVTSKPRDRRLLIEEAAGLGKHRKRRRRAQLKLDRTQDNLDRALDVEREARSRLRPLKRQAEAAELHARLERQTLEVRWRAVARRGARAPAGARRRAARRDGGSLPGVPRSSGSSSRWPAGARRPRRRWLRAAPSARSCRAATFAARGAAERRLRIAPKRSQSVLATLRARLRRAGRPPPALRAALRGAAGRAWDSAATAGSPRSSRRARSARPRPRGRARARSCEHLEQQRAAGRRASSSARPSSCSAAAPIARPATRALEQRRAAVREAERAVEARAPRSRPRRRRAGRRQPVPAQPAAARRAAGSSLADALDVDPGYELALAAALDGRLGAAVVEDREAGGACSTGTGGEGGRAFIVDPDVDRRLASGARTPPAGGARLLDHVRGGGAALALARALLRTRGWSTTSGRSPTPSTGWPSRVRGASGPDGSASCARPRRSARSACWRAQPSRAADLGQRGGRAGRARRAGCRSSAPAPRRRAPTRPASGNRSFTGPR